MLFLYLFSLPAFSQGKIDQSKEELKNGVQKKESSKKQNFESNDQTIREAFVQQGISAGIGLIIVYGIIGNYGSEIHLSNKLTRYPFERRLAGNYINTDSMSKPKYFRIDVENQFLYNSDALFGNHLKINVRPFQYFYVQGNVFLLDEFDDFNKQRSSLHLFNLDFCYDRIRFERFNLGWTMGVNYIGNGVKKAGFAYGLSAEWFVMKAISINSCGKLSHINGLPVNQFEAKAKYHNKNFYFSAGYEYLKIASPSYHFLSVGGGIYF
ncbi:MAG: hypothetical protein K0R51_2961 [Cytophagaceae bacterium]|nr:hypothetical protein [Cytophagaceae bacterium]